MKVVVRKTEYPRKAAEFSVLVTGAGLLDIGFCALPATAEPRAKVVAAAMERLIETEEGRALVRAANEELF